MQRDARKYLFDVKQASDLIVAFSAGRSFDDYQRDAMLRSAIERQFEIIGEAVSQLARLDPAVTERLTEYRRIIAFRNILIHSYATIDDRIVWGMIEGKLPQLRMEVEALLGSDANPPPAEER